MCLITAIKCNIFVTAECINRLFDQVAPRKVNRNEDPKDNWGI